MSLIRFMLVFFILVFSTTSHAYSQDSTDEDRPNLTELLRELANMDLLQFNGGSEGVKKQQRKKIELAEQVLSHPDLAERERVFATISRLQSLGVLFSIEFQKKNKDQELNEEYTTAIQDGLSDPAPKVVLESTTANVSFRSVIFMTEPSAENAAAAADAIQELANFEPKIPMIQTSRRMFLEQLWQHENANSFFTQLKTHDEKLAKIVLDQLDETISNEKADFLWTKHFARLDDPFSIAQLAAMYETGRGTRKNYSQAARWYGQLSQLGDVRSKIKLGDFYLLGLGFKENSEKAVELFLECKGAGSRVATFKLAECYLKGTGVAQDKEKWRQLIAEAAKDAEPIEVQEVYLTIDFAKSADSYRLFYESLLEANPDNIYYLNNLAYSLLIGSQKDPEKSLQLIEQAIEKAPSDFSGISNFVDTKANALKLLGKTREAADLFESVLENIEDKKSVLKSLVECYEILDAEKAQKYRERLEKLSQETSNS